MAFAVEDGLQFELPSTEAATILRQSLPDLPINRQALVRARLRLLTGFAQLWVRFWNASGAEISGAHQWSAPSASPSADWQILEFDVVVPEETRSAAAGLFFGGDVHSTIAECEFRLVDDDIDAYLRRLVDKVAKEIPDLPRDCREAFLSTPRHLFLPDVAPATAYLDDAIPTRWGEEDGVRVAISSSSQPTMMAIMLRDLDLKSGMRVLEIGTGTGYNAAILARIVGAENVTSIDIDPEIVATALANLDRAGLTGIDARVADGWLGLPDRAPFDRIIVTVGVADIPPAWFDQLADDGAIVMPLSFQCAEYSVAFRKFGDRLKSTAVRICRFMDLRGNNARISYHRRDGWQIKHDSLTDVEAAEIASILALPSTALAIPPEANNGPILADYLVMRHWPTVEVSGPATTALDQSEAAIVHAVVDLDRRGAATPRASMGDPVAAEALRRLSTEWADLRRSGVDRIRLTAYPRSEHVARPRIRSTAARGVFEKPNNWIAWEFYASRG